MPHPDGLERVQQAREDLGDDAAPQDGRVRADDLRHQVSEAHPGAPLRLLPEQVRPVVAPLWLGFAGGRFVLDFVV